MNFIYNRDWLNTCLTAVGAATPAATQLAGCNVHLFKQGISPNPDTPLATFLAEECDFNGYAGDDSFTWSAPVNEGAGVQQLLSNQVAQFLCTGATTPNMVGGYFITDGDDTLLLGSRVFTPAIPMGTPGANITLILAVPLPLISAGEDGLVST